MGPGLGCCCVAPQARILEGGGKTGVSGATAVGLGVGLGSHARLLSCPLETPVYPEPANLPARKCHQKKHCPEAALLIQPLPGLGWGSPGLLNKLRRHSCPALYPLSGGGTKARASWVSPPATVALALSLRHWGACGGMCGGGTPGPGATVREAGLAAQGGSGPFLSTSPDGCPSPPGGGRVPGLWTGHCFPVLAPFPEAEGCPVWGEDPLEVSLPQAPQTPSSSAGVRRPCWGASCPPTVVPPHGPTA